jgi:putative peptide zinc metalloprotease protein
MTIARPTLQSRIHLHDLASRPDGADWIVGRVATGEFVGLPAEAMTFLDALRAGGTVGAAKRRTELAHGEDIDALDFTSDLIGLGFVAAVDDEVITEEQPRPPSLPWLRPHHVSWLFRVPVLAAVGSFIVAGAVVTAIAGFPGYRAFFALANPGLTLALVTVIGLAILALHEFSHLAAARAADVYGWFGWGTRLWFLVVQTSVPGLWMARRSVRLRVFLAGMTCDLVVYSAGTIGTASTSATSPAHHILALTCLITLVSLMEQFLFFMRTDVYLVVQELTGCKDLFGDATDYLRYLARRSARGVPASPSDPLADLPPAERRPVRLYAALMVVGCVVMVLVTAFYGLPVEIGIYVRVAHELARGLSTSRIPLVIDATGALAVSVAFQALLIRTLLRTYQPHLRRLLQRIRLQPQGGPASLSAGPGVRVPGRRECAGCSRPVARPASAAWRRVGRRTGRHAGQ